MPNEAHDLMPFSALRAVEHSPPAVVQAPAKLIANQVQSLLRISTPFSIAPRQIDEVLKPFKPSHQDRHSGLQLVWQRALHIFLQDDALTEAECSYLRRLAYLFDLSFDDTEVAFRSVVHPRFKAAVAVVMADSEITAKERNALSVLRSRLQVERYTSPMNDDLAEP